VLPTATSTPFIPASQHNVSYGPYERQKLDVYNPGGLVDAPIVLLVHSGGFYSGDKGEAGLVRDFYNQLGFVVVAPNYRLVTIDAQNAFPTPISDVGCAAAWAKKNAASFGGDGDNTFIVGYSAGAHIGAMLAYNDDRNWLDGCGIQGEELEFKGFVGFAGTYDFAERPPGEWFIGCFLSELLGIEPSREACAAWKDADPNKWMEANPVAFVSSGDPPALLLTGDKDYTVNVPDPITGKGMANSVRMAAVLDERGIDNELVVVPGADHSSLYVWLQTDKSVQRAVAGFLKRLATPTPALTPTPTSVPPTATPTSPTSSGNVQFLAKWGSLGPGDGRFSAWASRRRGWLTCRDGGDSVASRQHPR
jgi:acetyl esterase/lipase